MSLRNNSKHIVDALMQTVAQQYDHSCHGTTLMYDAWSIRKKKSDLENFLLRPPSV